MRIPAPDRRCLAGIAAAAAVLLAGLPAQAASAQTLDGERLASAAHIEGFVYDGVCNADGPSTFTYGAYGYGEGPVAGLFDHYGTITLASPSGPVTAYTASFSIDGGGTYVTGTKTLAEPGTGSCTAGEGGSLNAEIPATYAVDSPFAESGPARVTISGAYNAGTFVATLGDPPQTGPSAKEDCMNGGWAGYGFPNQGQCIRSVESRSPRP